MRHLATLKGKIAGQVPLTSKPPPAPTGACESSITSFSLQLHRNRGLMKKQNPPLSEAAEYHGGSPD